MDTLIAPCRGCGASGFGVRDGLCARCGALERRGSSLPLDRRAQARKAKDAMDQKERRALAKARVEDPSRAARMIAEKVKQVEREEAVDRELLEGAGEEGQGEQDNHQHQHQHQHQQQQVKSGDDGGDGDFEQQETHPYYRDQQGEEEGEGEEEEKEVDGETGNGKGSAAARLARLRRALGKARRETGTVVRDEERRLADPAAERRRAAEAQKEARKSRSGDTGPTVLDCELAGATSAARVARREASKFGADYLKYESEALRLAALDGAGAGAVPGAPAVVSASGGHVSAADVYRELNGGQVNVEGRARGADRPHKSRAEAIASMAALATAKKRSGARAEKRRAAGKGPTAIDHVNDPNRRFNEALEKSYGKVTAETKQALERGTAL